jgi:hypothetical protein
MFSSTGALDEHQRLALIDVRQVNRERHDRGEHRAERGEGEQPATSEDVDNPDRQRIVSG